MPEVGLPGFWVGGGRLAAMGQIGGSFIRLWSEPRMCRRNVEMTQSCNASGRFAAVW